MIRPRRSLPRAEHAARAGDHNRAERIARSLTDPDQQAWTLTDLAGAVAAAGDHDRARTVAIDAERIARSLTDPDQQAWALTNLAETVGLPVACRLLGEAFAVGSWLIPLPVVAKPAPQVVIQVANAMYSDDRSGPIDP